MKTPLFFSLFLFCSITSFSQTENSLIPIPSSVTKQPGSFSLHNNLVIGINSDAKKIAFVAGQLSKELAAPTGFKISVNKNIATANIQLQLLKTRDNDLGDEGYKLSVSQKAIIISANKAAGLFYGTQTLLQLLPKEIENKSVVKNISWKIACVEISDQPRFAWRGLMFDVSRHFFGKKDVEDFIDNMVKYKFNLLHLHLTDDEGWRVEIKSLPRLTSVGAWNVKRVGTFGDFSAPTPDEPKNYGGFFTQEDIKEIVSYAKDRFVNILPEVDIPGHSLAAIVSYPELSCTPGAEKYQVRSGEKIMDWQHGLVALVDNTICPANEKVYPFLDKVFTELAQLFPFEYIHIGGDECAKNFWEKSDAVKQLMQKEGLKTMEEVQSYFEKRVEKIVESKGKKVIGWDEILEGGLAPNAAVMSWRGMKGGIAAAKMGHEVVMSPTDFVYLDLMQGDRIIEPLVYGTMLLKKVYSFEPVPDSVDAKLIKGGQANLWTEQIYNTRHMQYMLWPRALAVAECLWSVKQNKNWDSFTKRTESIFERMDVEHVKYARSMFDPMFDVKRDANNELQIILSTEVNGLDIYYSFDNSNPDNYYPKYLTPLSVPKDASMIKVVTYRDGKQIGRQIDMPIATLKSRLPKK
ncbi:beta-hexosaminidase [mine drainage metagenome]|uniref:beta-N-acetylhexosaminidase n=1 Tax=mine drainage metagenome TaxID=410659 RepID=A0A1J5T186_9ZZZZ